jgi:hypothetical protein
MYTPPAAKPAARIEQGKTAPKAKWEAANKAAKAEGKDDID